MKISPISLSPKGSPEPSRGSRVAFPPSRHGGHGGPGAASTTRAGSGEAQGWRWANTPGRVGQAKINKLGKYWVTHPRAAKVGRFIIYYYGLYMFILVYIMRYCGLLLGLPLFLVKDGHPSSWIWKTSLAAGVGFTLRSRPSASGGGGPAETGAGEVRFAAIGCCRTRDVDDLWRSMTLTTYDFLWLYIYICIYDYISIIPICNYVIIYDHILRAYLIIYADPSWFITFITYDDLRRYCASCDVAMQEPQRFTWQFWEGTWRLPRRQGTALFWVAWIWTGPK